MFYRLGLAVVRRRYLVVGLWLVVVLAGLPFAPRVARALAPGGFSTPGMESRRAVDALQRGLQTTFGGVLVIFSSPTLTADDPRFVAEADAAVSKLRDWPEVSRIVPFALNPAQVSRDRHAAYTAVFLEAGSDDALEVLPGLRARLERPPSLEMELGGGPIFYEDIQAVSEADLRRAEAIALPFALAALLVVFRSVVAAGLPASVGGASVVVSLALLYVFATLSPVSVFALNITTLFGLGLGVDYSLFVVSRFREELEAGRDVPEAVGVTLATAGRAVLFSGLAVSILPPSAKSRAAFDLLGRRFDAAAATPIVLAVETPGSPLDQPNLVALDAYVRSLQADPRVERVDSIVSLDPRLTLRQYQLLYGHPASIADPFVARSLAALAGPSVTMIQVVSRHGMLDPRSESLVRTIRGTPPPGGLRVLVGGGTAGVVDYVSTLYGELPKALLVVGAVTYVVLALLFRSLVLPLKALVMNVFSILASYGALVYVFQEGHFSRLLGFTPLGFVEASGPILMFCALFGLSMDYEVFLLSRVREAYEQTGDNARSVAVGLERSGRIITSAAAIVILVSFAFASADLVIVKALGVGMALAVLLDATIVRGLVVPATMRLLGDVNWYWPAPLSRLLPGVVFRDAASPAPASRGGERSRIGAEPAEEHGG